MELIRWNCVHICNASSPFLQTKLAINCKVKANLHLPKPLSLSRRWICSLSHSKSMDGQVNHLKEGGKMMWVIVTGFILCFGTPVCNNPALGQTLDLGQPQEMVDRCKEGMPTDTGAEEKAITNEGIVEEAWLVVNENFLDARHHTWSAEAWLKKKEEALSRPIQTRSTAHDIIRRMLATLDDPYTRFLTPSEGDEILSVNGKSVEGMTSSDVASLIQGPKETFVSLEVKHGDCGDSQNVIIERQQVIRTPVFYRLEKDENGNEDMGYIRLKEFNALARRDLTTAMRRLKDAGASHFVLDLRDNPGGLVQAGIEIAKLFLESGDPFTKLARYDLSGVGINLKEVSDEDGVTKLKVLGIILGGPAHSAGVKQVIYTVGRDLDSQKSILAQSPALITVPLMVLVNGHTASASEIVAAALHDNCRAILVGERTFGKGLIQSVYELEDGSAVVVTVGKYVTPTHRDIDGNGIEPDFHYRPGLVEAKKTLSRCRVPAEFVTRDKLL